MGLPASLCLLLFFCWLFSFPVLTDGLSLLHWTNISLFKCLWCKVAFLSVSFPPLFGFSSLAPPSPHYHKTKFITSANGPKNVVRSSSERARIPPYRRFWWYFRKSLSNNINGRTVLVNSDHEFSATSGAAEPLGSFDGSHNQNGAIKSPTLCFFSSLSLCT